MPRAFTEVEKEKIRGRLFAAGRSCFTRYGLKKTTIDDLVKSARIAKSSYYLFFESKEALYMELMMAEMPAMAKRLVDLSFGTTDDARKALVLLLRAIVREIETNEFARIVFDDPGHIEQLSAAIDFEGIMEQSEEIFEPLFQAITKAQAQGKIIAGNPQKVIYSLGLIKIIPLGKGRLPKALYDSMLEFAPQVIADGLTCPARGGER